MILDLNENDPFYLGLHHMWSIQSHLVHKVINGHCVFFLKLLKQHIQRNDGACPPHTSTERGGTKVEQVMCRYDGHQQVVLKTNLQEAPQLTYSGFNIKTEHKRSFCTCSEPQWVQWPLLSVYAVSSVVGTQSGVLCILGLRGQARQ